jgi:hypothetical protein
MAVALLLTLATNALASDLAPNYQAVFLLRILAYDRNLKNRAGDTVTILVVYRDGDDGSTATKNELLAGLDKLSDAKVSDLPYRVIATPFTSPADLEGAINNNHAAAVYLCPGLDGSVNAISDLARAHSTLTFTGVEAQVRSRLSIGLVARSGKPAILVNLASSRAEGADLDPALLRLAEVLR